MLEPAASEPASTTEPRFAYNDIQSQQSGEGHSFAENVPMEDSETMGSGRSEQGDDDMIPTAEVPYPGFEETVFRCLPQTNRLRLTCLYLITSPWFERVVILIILLNCVTLGMYQPCKDANGCTDTRCKVLAVFDHVIYAFFLIEMLIKVTAMGFLGKKGYIAEAWNRLDLFIILAGAAEYGLDNGEINLSAIRTIRVLRPLRAINRIPNLRILVMLLLDTLPMLGNVLLICFFVFFIFGILGVQLWAGMLRQRCFMPDSTYDSIQSALKEYNSSLDIGPYYTGGWSSLAFICSMEDSNGMLTCQDIQATIENEFACTEPFTPEVLSPDYRSGNNSTCVNYNQYYSECRPDGPNPFLEAISFDNIARAWIAIFQVISLEGWVDIMYYIQDVHSYWVWIYFLALIVIGSFFMVNLFLVVIATQFSETKRRETEKIAEERKRYKSSTTLVSTKTDSEGCYNQLLKYVIHLCRQAHRRTKRKYHIWKERRKAKLILTKENHDENDISDIHLNLFSNHIHCKPCYHMLSMMESCAVPVASPEHSEIDSVSQFGRSRGHSPQFFHRNEKGSPAIFVSVGQDETSFANSLHTGSSVGVQNGGLKDNGLKIMVDASEGRENMALLKVVSPHSDALSTRSSKISSIHSSAHSSPQPSPQMRFRQNSQDIQSPTSLEAGDQCRRLLLEPTNEKERPNAVSKHLTVPGSHTPNLLQVPGDGGSSHSIHSNSSVSPGPGARRRPIPENNRFSFSQLSYMHGECDLLCAECQHLCVELQKQEKAKINEDEMQFSLAHRCAGKLRKWKNWLKAQVNSNAFRNGIFLFILINTVMMGMEHHGQPPLLTQIVEYSNYVFIAIFSIEMLLKLLAEGPLQYVKDVFNVFDGFIVIMSYIELGMEGEDSGLSVLRTFRLLRILKLVRFLPALQRQFIVMIRTLDNVASFFGLLMLFMFIFSVLGMNLFGCQFCDIDDEGNRICDRRNNFDSLLWSLITVFQILTQEDWNIIMYDGMHETSPYAALYFIALMTIGNYVLFNLLVAILVEGFSSVLEHPCQLCGRAYACSCPLLLRADAAYKAVSIGVSISAQQTQRGDVSESLRLKDLDEEEEDQVQNEEVRQGNPLPSIITDHADMSCRDVRRLPPTIIHTDATPRGSPKSDVMSSPYGEASSILSCSSFEQSPSNSRRSNGTPRLCRKNSGSSRCGKRQRSDDKISLVESAMDDEEEMKRSIFMPSRADSRSSIQNFDLLQVPRNCGLSKTGLASDAAISVVSFDMDHSSLDKMEALEISAKHRLSPLSLQIPDQHITPPTSKRNCNGMAFHPPLARMNGGLLRSGERTSLLIASKSESLDGPRERNHREAASPIIARRTPSGSSIYLAEEDGRHTPLSISHASMYSKLDESREMEKQFPYSDQEKSERLKQEPKPKAPSYILKKLTDCCRPRGCLIDRRDYAFYLLPPSNPVRRFCKWLSSRKWFDYAILVLIGLNCITLAVERPSIPDDSPERQVLQVSNYVFTVLFLIEMVIKVIAKGLVIGPNTYLRDGWNVNDGFLVLVSVIDIGITISMAESPKIFGVLRVLRLLRALRPLRVISRAPGLKLVVETLLSSLRPIGNIVLICLTFFLIFGILGVQLFRGKFYHCDIPPSFESSLIVNRTDCLENDLEWVNHKYNFDDLGNALMSLFVLSSKDGWVMIMYQGLDAVGVDQQPIENHNQWVLLYFISFLLLVGFFVLNMFVGVVVENFHRCREAHEKEERIKRELRKKKKLDKMVATSLVVEGGEFESRETPNNNDLRSTLNCPDSGETGNTHNQEINEPPYYTHYSKNRQLVHKIVMNKYFDIAVAMIIFLNVISMAIEHYQMSREMVFALNITNYVFTFIFMLEAIFKVTAFGFIRYIKERWNQLDLLIIILSLLGIVLEAVQTDVIPINPTIMRVMRILRIARVLKLLKVAKGIRALLDTVLVALPQVGNLGLLFFLLFFIFAALGVELFGRIECSAQNPCEGMGVHANFEDSGAAFLTLFRIATGDNWNGIMKDCLRENCDPSSDCTTNCCVNKIITPIYFVVFVLTAQFVLVNVVVAVLMKHLEHFEESRDCQSDAHLSVEDILYGQQMALDPSNEEDQQALLAARQQLIVDLEFNSTSDSAKEATVFDKYFSRQNGRVKERTEEQDNASFTDDGNNNQDHEREDQDRVNKSEIEGSIESQHRQLKPCRSQLLLPKHKPLSKHLSLPSDFKIHPISDSKIDSS